MARGSERASPRASEAGAVRDAVRARYEQTVGPPELTWGQRVVLEALRGRKDDVLVAAAPCVQELVATSPLASVALTHRCLRSPTDPPTLPP